MTFAVGDRSENNIGRYQVLVIVGDQMTVQYEDGHHQVLSVKLQEQIVVNRQARLSVSSITASDRRTTRTIRSYNWVDGRAYQTMGFLLKRVIRIGANLTTDKEQSFKEEYQFVKGVPLADNCNAVSYLREGANQWGNQGVIRFKAKESELSLLSFSRRGNTPYSSDGYWEVKDMGFLFFLLEHGFNLGSKQDEDSILSKIPAYQHSFFDKGVEYGLHT